MPALTTPVIWALLVVANFVSFAGVIRWKGRSEAGERKLALLAMGMGGVLELAAIVLLFMRYTHRL